MVSGDFSTRARWIWPKGSNPFTAHQWAWFRKDFDLQRPGPARIEIAADLRYHLWINGRLVGFGPPRYHASTPTVDVYEVEGFLRRGRNIMAVLVYSYGGAAPLLSSCMPVRGGLRVCLKSGKFVLVSDASWKAKIDPAYAASTLKRGDMQPPAECYDVRACLGRPWEADFRDRAWLRAAELSANPPGENWEVRDIPLFRTAFHRPDRIVASGLARFSGPPGPAHSLKGLPKMLRDARREPAPDGSAPGGPVPVPDGQALVLDARGSGSRIGRYATFDFGRIWTGYPVIEVQGTPGTIVDLSYAEHLVEGRLDPAKHLPYCDRIVLGRRPVRHRITWPKCLRYLQVDVRGGKAEILDLGLERSSYPVQRRGTFASSDPVLDQAWEISIHTVELCMEDSYLDTPWRERGAWIGDDLVKWQANWIVFGDTALMKRFLLHHARGQLPNGAMQGKYPGGKTSHISTWTLCYAASVADYVRTAVDRAMAAHLLPVLRANVAWLERFRTPDGIYGNLPVCVTAHTNVYNFIDWAPVLTNGCNAAWNAFAFRFLESCAEVAQSAGSMEEAAVWHKSAESLRDSCRRLFWNKALGVFGNTVVDGQLSRRWGCQENYLNILFGIATPAQRRRILARLRRENLSKIFIGNPEVCDIIIPECGPSPAVAIALSRYPWPDTEMVPLGTAWFAGFALEAMCEMGLVEEALDFIRLRWGEFSRQGGTTVWETWDARNGSLSHAWSSAPVVVFARHLLGVREVASGVEILPHFGSLRRVAGRVNTRQGVVQVEVTSGQQPSLIVCAPDGCPIVAGLPARNGRRILLNGRPTPLAGQTTRRGIRYDLVHCPSGKTSVLKHEP